MLAIDTNLIIRYLANDHPDQAARARTLIDGEDVFVSRTVLLETEWVLRSIYGYAAIPLIKALRAFASLPRVVVEDAGLVAKALDWAEGGMDFADALHLAKATGYDGFVTFDRRFTRAANRLSAVKVRAP